MQSSLQQSLRLPKVASSEVVLAARCRRTYSNAHTYHINSVSVSSDQVPTDVELTAFT